MRKGRVSNLGWLAGGLALFLALNTVLADDRETIEELRQRVVALEQQNAGQKGQEEQEAKEKEKKLEPEFRVFEVGKDLGFRTRWEHGLVSETEDKAFRIHVGGRTQFDGAWISTTDPVQFGPGGIGNVEDAVNFRRARLEVDGTMYEVFDFFCEYDFLNTFNTDVGGDKNRVVNVPVPTDLFVTITHLPFIGHVRMGNTKPFIGFEHLISSRFLNFMERSLGFDAFIENQDNGFEPGIETYNWTEDERMAWGLGFYKNTRGIFGWNLGDGEYELTSRVTGLPWWEEDGRCFLHLGLGGSYRDMDDDEARYRARILIRNGPATVHNIIAEARMRAERDYRLNPELVLQIGPFLFQSEYTAVWTNEATFPRDPPAARINRGTAYYQAYYVEVLYFLTGEHRGYNRTGMRPGTFGRVMPRENFFFVNGEHGRLLGRGAWQVAARYNYLDLESKGINGGAQSNGAIINDWTLGLNWFLSPNMKIQWNYSIAYREAIGGLSNGPIHAFGSTVRFDF